MTIKYNNLAIKKTTIEDADYLFQWWNDGKVMAHAGFPNGLNISKEKIISQIQDQSKNRFILFIDTLAIGECNFNKVTENIYEIGMKICNSDFQNKGYGYIYYSLLINYIFEQLNATKVILDTNINNKRAMYFYEHKLHFTKLRINKDSFKDQLGVYQTSVDYQLLKVDFNLTLDKTQIVILN